MSQLRVFSLPTCRHVPDQLRRNLIDRGDQMILVEYHLMRGYKLYDAVKKISAITMDVIFY